MSPDSSGGQPLLARVKRRVGVPKPATYIRRLLRSGECRTALDVGCGPSSTLAQFRDELHTVGIDAFPEAVEAAKRAGTHHDYIVGNVLELSDEELLAPVGGEPYDLVVLLHLVEHFPKSVGYRLLERCEQLTRKFVVVETPNGYLEQGPEYGNEFQRHLSGWFVHDFEGLAYRVYGSYGTRFIRGYAGRPKLLVPGAQTADALLARTLGIGRHPRNAFSLVAIKDVRGVPARLG